MANVLFYVKAAALNISGTTVWTGKNGLKGHIVANNQNKRAALDASNISNVSGTYIRIKIEGPNSANAVGGGAEFTSMYVGFNNNGSSPDFISTPTQITWNNGSTSVTVPADTDLWSDWVAFSSDGTQNLMVAAHVGTTGNVITNYTGDESECIETWRYTGADESSVVDVTDGNYISSAHIFFHEVQVGDPT